MRRIPVTWIVNELIEGRRISVSWIENLESASGVNAPQCVLDGRRVVPNQRRQKRGLIRISSWVNIVGKNLAHRAAISGCKLLLCIGIVKWHANRWLTFLIPRVIPPLHLA